MATETEAPAVTAGNPPTADPQDPLPESNWKFRRWFTFIGEVVSAFLLGYVIWTLATIGAVALEAAGQPPARSAEVSLAVIAALFKIGIALIIRSGISVLLYLVAPSAEQAGKWMATLSAWRGGISTSVQSRVSSSSGTASTSTVTGPAVVEPTSPTSPAPVAPAASGGTRVSGGAAGQVPPVVDLSQE